MDALGAAVGLAGVSCLVSTMFLALYREPAEVTQHQSPLLIIASNITTIGIVAAVFVFLLAYLRALVWARPGRTPEI